jgi:hypothetical protein
MPRPASKLLLSAALLALIFACAAVARDVGAHQNARAEISQASGQLKITNSRNGQAIFQAAGLAPGRSVTGTVQLSNTGKLAGDLRVAQVNLQDQPGANGGRLSDAVQLAINDITGGSSIPVYGGRLKSVGTRTLGKLAAGKARTYRFTATLPSTGTPPSPTGGDNAYIGSRVTLGYAWTATAPSPTPPRPRPRPPVTPVAPVVKVKVVSKKLLKRGQLDLMTTCSVACKVSAYAQLPKVKAAKKGKKKKAKALKTRKRNVTIAVPNKMAKIRLKLSKKARKQLAQALRKKKKVKLLVRMTVTGTAGGPATSVSRKVVVKRPKKKKRRR